jgi:hypothetical protein
MFARRDILEFGELRGETGDGVWLVSMKTIAASSADSFRRDHAVHGPHVRMQAAAKRMRAEASWFIPSAGF